MISDMRAKHGKESVKLERCGTFTMAEDFSDFVDMTHIDLSGITSLEGLFLGTILRSPQYEVSTNAPNGRQPLIADWLAPWFTSIWSPAAASLVSFLELSFAYQSAI